MTNSERNETTKYSLDYDLSDEESNEKLIFFFTSVISS